MKRIVSCIVVLAMLTGCGGSGDIEETPTVEPVTKPIPVYNQAYIENYDVADTIDEIITNARDAYVMVDPFDDNVDQNVDTIKSLNNQVAGYISAGTGEDWREDFSALEPYLVTKAWPEWPGEYFVNETTTGILDVMKLRIDKMTDWGLDWVEFDNMDWLDEETRNEYDLQATVAEAKAYINDLCDYTHAKGLKCMAKNTVDSFENFDGVLYESYNDDKNWWNVEGTKSFLAAGKLVIINHYNETDCDGVYAEYQKYYNSENISFICEDIGLQRYKHYNE